MRGELLLEASLVARPVTAELLLSYNHNYPLAFRGMKCLAMFGSGVGFGECLTMFGRAPAADEARAPFGCGPRTESRGERGRMRLEPGA